MTSAERIVSRPPRHAILAQRAMESGRLGRKPISSAEADRRMIALVEQIANQPQQPLNPQMAEIVAKALGKRWNEMNQGEQALNPSRESATQD